MPSHDNKEPHEGGRLSDQHVPGGHEPEPVDISAGYEVSDVKVTGIIVFLVALGVFVMITGLLCYGIGKVINAHMNKEDGPNTRWTQTVDIRQLGNLPSSPEMQNKVAELTQSFPAPRVQTDDGNQDVADLHQREDLLLEHYSWVDQKSGKVRIPIERAMEMVVSKNMVNVMPAAKTQAPMTGDARPQVTVPLTDGFARTAYEQEQAATNNAKKASEAASK